MKQAIGLGLAAMAFAFAGCASAPTPSEKQASTTSNLSGGGVHDCIGSIQAPIGSADWQAQLRQCAQNARSEAPSGGGESCSSGVSCVNGACTCTSGPNQGQSCDGSTDTGANSCSTLCNDCSGSGGGGQPPAAGDDDDDTGGAPLPGGGALPGGGDPGGNGNNGCTSGISCVNGACTCTSGPSQGQSCDGSTDTGPSSCSTLCSTCSQ